MRTDYAIKNIKYTVLMYITNYIMKFVVRSVFVYTLPLEYLGVNTLLNDILIMLCVTEMGISTAIVYSLYKPLSINDTFTVKAIMKLFKKVYSCIGSAILILGLMLTPFLDYWIKDSNIENLKYYFIIFLLTDSIGYFFSYKWSLLIADQKQFIYNYYHSIFLILLSFLQIIFLLLFKSYWTFVLIIFFIKTLECYYISFKANKIYPFLKDLSNENLNLSEEIKKNIINNTKALILNKISTIINSSSFSVITSKYIGINSVALYSNYALILGALSTFCANIFWAISANIGNIVVTESAEKNTKIFKFLFFISAWQGAIILNLLYLGLNDFIYLWLGDKFLFNKNIVNFFLALFYINYMQNIVTLFKESAGLYWQERWRPVIETIFNLFLAIVLVDIYDITGILIASIMSKLLTSFWIEPYILFNNGIKISLKLYFREYFKYSAIILLMLIFNNYLNYCLFVGSSIYNFMLKILLGFIVVNGCWVFIFRKYTEMEYFREILRGQLGVKFL